MNSNFNFANYTVGNGSGNLAIGTTGKQFESSTKRICLYPLADVHLYKDITISVVAGYQYYIYAFDRELTTIVADTGWMSLNQKYSLPSGAYYVTIVISKVNNDDISVVENTNVSMLASYPAGLLDTVQDIQNMLYADVRPFDNDGWAQYVIGNGTSHTERDIGTTGKQFEYSTTRISLYPLVDTHYYQKLSVSVGNGYKFYLFGFNQALTSVVIDSGWTTEETEYFISTSNAYYMSICLAHTDNTAISLEEQSNIQIVTELPDGRLVNIESEIENLNVNELEIPEYWQSYFDGKQSELTLADMSLGFYGVSFAFITDVHVNTNNKVSPELLNYITRHTNVKEVVCGGDIITNYNTKVNALSEIKFWTDSTSELDVVNLHGNHDGNSNNQTDNTQIITDAEFYALCCKQAEKYVNWVSGKLYGYRDNDVQKVRYLYLDTGAPDSAIIDSDQINWLKQKIQELDAGWTVIVFCHQFWTGDVSSTPTLNIDSNGTAILNALESIYNSVNATIACVITGHCHRNYSMISSKGFPIIATTCDAGQSNASTYDPDTPNRTPKSTSEQCFDLYYVNTSSRTINTIRIGAGDIEQNRSFTY